jgi:hypothetical protein
VHLHVPSTICGVEQKHERILVLADAQIRQVFPLCSIRIKTQSPNAKKLGYSTYFQRVVNLDKRIGKIFFILYGNDKRDQIETHDTEYQT